MTWKIELAALAITAATVGGYLHTADLFETEPVTYHDKFTQSDFETFDRGFPIGSEICGVGLQPSRTCLPAYKTDQTVRIGEPLPKDIPALSAGMRVLLALDAKKPNLKTVRYGQTLVLIDSQTEIVEDVLRLDAPSYATARNPKLRGAPIATAAK